MSIKPSIRETVLRSLDAIGATQDASFYAALFQAQDPERFAMIVLDPRCLKNPLLEALISDLRILSELGLTPVLLIGAFDDDRTAVKYQSQRLTKELESASIFISKLNTATYGLIPEIAKFSRQGRLPLLEMTERRGPMNLQALVEQINPHKVIFLQPSGGLSRDGLRVASLNIDDVEDSLDVDRLSAGQQRFVSLAKSLSSQKDRKTVYVMASPLNLLTELFTTKGSGTMLRRAASLEVVTTLKNLDRPRLQSSLETAFEKSLQPAFLTRKIHKAFVDSDYRGGAIIQKRDDLAYLSKFWVIKAAQGEGIARDIWDALCADIPTFFWRSRRGNPFNDWYMQTCDGMQVSGDWRIFWKGLGADHIHDAITAASDAPDDFLLL